MGEWEAAFFRSPIPCCPLLLVCGADATRSERSPLLPPPLLATCASKVFVERRDPPLPLQVASSSQSPWRLGEVSGHWAPFMVWWFCSPPTRQRFHALRASPVPWRAPHNTPPSPQRHIASTYRCCGRHPPQGAGIGRWCCTPWQSSMPSCLVSSRGISSPPPPAPPPLGPQSAPLLSQPRPWWLPQHAVVSASAP